MIYNFCWPVKVDFVIQVLDELVQQKHLATHHNFLLLFSQPKMRVGVAF